MKIMANTQSIKKVNGVAITEVIGGRSREVSVVLDKDKMAENKIDFLGVSQKIQVSTSQSNSGKFSKNDRDFLVHTGEVRLPLGQGVEALPFTEL